MNARKITDHSVERAQERLQLSKKKAEKNIRKALSAGRRATDYQGRARRYLEKIVHGNAYGVVYQGFCYVISTYTGHCITVFKLPDWWSKEEQRRKWQTRYTRANSPTCGETHL